MLHTYEEAEARDAFFQALDLPIPIDEVKYILSSLGEVYAAESLVEPDAYLCNAFGLGFRTKKEGESPEAKARLAAILKYGGFKNE